MSNLDLIPTAGVGSIREVWGSTPPKTTQRNSPQEIGGLIEGLLTIIRFVNIILFKISCGFVFFS